MKSVLVSIQPKWCEFIASGKKTIEIRKTAPKEVPFKAYIYETKGKKKYWSQPCPIPYYEGKGKIIGEFICDKVEDIDPAYGYLDACCQGGNSYILDKCCLSRKELIEYGKSSKRSYPWLYGWHISELKIYDKPKELTDVTTRKKVYNGMCGKIYKPIQITRPPQSWCYVEEVR